MLSAGLHDIDAASETLRKFIATDGFKRSVLFFKEQAKPLRPPDRHRRKRTITVHLASPNGRHFNAHRDMTISNKKVTFTRKDLTHHKSELTCAVITTVRPRSAGALAGLQPGMIIATVDDNVVPTLSKEQLTDASRQPARVAQTLIDVAIQRTGQVTLTIKE
jgi:membrane-associated protease RseP (regulator of RpoE activity)